MKTFIVILLIGFSSCQINAQILISKDSLKLVFKETLKKSRNAVPTANNVWVYDNSNNDYFEQDTITLNTARSYKRDYFKTINWSFYDENKFILENANSCNEPPIKNISKEEDYFKLKIKNTKDSLFLKLYNSKGLFETFNIIYFKRNEPISVGEEQFDYTMKLKRIK